MRSGLNRVCRLCLSGEPGLRASSPSETSDIAVQVAGTSGRIIECIILHRQQVLREASDEGGRMGGPEQEWPVGERELRGWVGTHLARRRRQGSRARDPRRRCSEVPKSGDFGRERSGGCEMQRGRGVEDEGGGRREEEKAQERWAPRDVPRGAAAYSLICRNRPFCDVAVLECGENC